MAQSKPAAATIYTWLRANLGPRCLAPLTSSDAYALKAAVQIIELYAYNRDPDIARAFGLIVRNGMQRRCQFLAYHAIAHVMDWSNRSEIWQDAGLEPFTDLPSCKFEPAQ
jgi:hypothetical protein